MSKMNVRHDLDPVLVQAQVEEKVAGHELNRIRFKREAQATLESYEQDKLLGKSAHWSKVPAGPAYVDPMIDEWIARERNEYALARVIELPKDGKRFVLAYGDVEDAAVTGGTGPFESVETAAKWFFTGGR